MSASIPIIAFSSSGIGASRWFGSSCLCPSPRARRGCPSLRLLDLTILGLAPRGPMAAAEVDLIRGTLDLLILKTLSWGPMHGLAVLRWIEQTTKDQLQIEEGALYPSLHRMEEK